MLKTVMFVLFFCLSANAGSYSLIDEIQNSGYLAEIHHVVTADGYILQIHRIPGKIDETVRPVENRPTIFLQHGLLCSSTNWILLGPKKALAYLLSDQGYDVWMGNFRGNTYSKNHTFLNSRSKKFWSFSWHEMGLYDLPAMLDYVLHATNSSQLSYVGHSQGAAAFFVMGSIRPEYNQKIKAMYALAPAAFIAHARSPIFRILAPMLEKLKYLMFLFGDSEFFPNSLFFEIAGELICKDSSVLQLICTNALFLMGGYNTESLNKTLLPEIVSTTPAGASVNQIIHFAQSYRADTFRMFDYGYLQNLYNYKSLVPPTYDLQLVSTPVTIYYGANDWLVGVEDVKKLSSKLGNLQKSIKVSNEKWTHLDFIFGNDVKQHVFDDLLEKLKISYVN